MRTYLAQESAVIDAPAERSCEIIADYHEGHPAIPRDLLEKVMNPFITRRIYREELQQLAKVAIGRVGVGDQSGGQTGLARVDCKKSA